MMTYRRHLLDTMHSLPGRSQASSSQESRQHRLCLNRRISTHNKPPKMQSQSSSSRNNLNNISNQGSNQSQNRKSQLKISSTYLVQAVASHNPSFRHHLCNLNLYLSRTLWE